MTTAAPVWRSGFRPFFLAAACHAVVLMAAWVAARLGPAAALGYDGAVWHGHEAVFGFVAATAAGFLLTALPSWAGAPDIRGRPLMVLAGLWLAGRLALLLPLPAAPAALADGLFFPALAALLWPGVWRAADRRYRLVLLILAGFAAGNLLWHGGRLGGDAAMQMQGIRLGTYALLLLFGFVGGLLTPVFTANALGRAPRFTPWLEVLAPAALVVLAVCDLAGAPPAAVAAAALAAALAQLLRMAGWRAWAVRHEPILAAMHLGHLWFVLALLLTGLAAVEPAWRGGAVHAFTVGGLGLMKLSIMTRVALKHTGRPVALPPVLTLGLGAVTLAAVLRVAAGFGWGGDGALMGAALLWAAPFAAYLVLYAPVLLRPSLARPLQPA